MFVDLRKKLDTGKVWGQRIKASHMIMYYDTLNKKLWFRYVSEKGNFQTIEQALQKLNDEPQYFILLESMEIIDV